MKPRAKSCRRGDPSALQPPLAEGDVRSKTHPGDLVTIADEEAEVLLGQKFMELLPGSRVVGEEAVSRDSAVLDLLAGDEPTRLVDPIDGTSNFVNGIARFAMIVALVWNGETVMGWIYEPMIGATFLAERVGRGGAPAPGCGGPRRAPASEGT